MTAGRTPLRWPWLDGLLGAVVLSIGAWTVHLRPWNEPSLLATLAVAMAWYVALAGLQTRRAGATVQVLAVVTGVVGMLFLTAVAVLTIAAVGVDSSYGDQALIVALLATAGVVVLHAAALASVVSDARRRGASA